MSTQGVGPGGALTGLNPRRDPTVIDFYKENIPRGSNVLYRTVWETATGSTNAVLTIPNTGPFVFNRGINDNFTLYVDQGLQQTIEIDPGYYTLEGLVAQLNFTSLETTIINGRIKFSSYTYGETSKIRVGSGTANDTLGLISETVVRGTTAQTGKSPIIKVNLQQDNYNATVDYFKSVKFTMSNDLQLDTSVIVLQTKHVNYSFGSETESVVSLLALCSPSSINTFTVNDVTWHTGEIVFPVPIKINSAEADFLSIFLYDTKTKQPVSTGLLQGTLFITLEGWTIDVGLQ